MDNINGISIRWNVDEDRELLGRIFPEGMDNAALEAIQTRYEYRSPFMDRENIPHGDSYITMNKTSEFSCTGYDADGKPGYEYCILTYPCADGAEVYATHKKQYAIAGSQMNIYYEKEAADKNNLFGSFYIADMSKSYANHISELLNSKNKITSKGRRDDKSYYVIKNFEDLITYAVTDEINDGPKKAVMDYECTYNAVRRAYDAQTGAGRIIEAISSRDELAAKGLNWCADKLEGIKLTEKNYEPGNAAYNPLIGFSPGTKETLNKAAGWMQDIADNPMVKNAESMLAEAYGYVKKALESIARFVYDKLPKPVQRLLTAINELIHGIKNAINDILEGIAAFVKKFIDFIDEAIKLLNAFVCGILNGIIGLVQAILMVLAFLVDMAGPDFGYEEYLKRRDMGEKLESVIDFISDSFGGLMGAVKDLFTQSADATIDDLKQFLQSIGSLLQQGGQAVEDFWDNTSRYQFAYWAGLVVFEIIINILLLVFTGGLGNIARASTAYGKIVAGLRIFAKEAFSVVTFGIVEFLQFFRSIIAGFVKACSKGIKGFFRWVEELLKGLEGGKGKSGEEVLGDAADRANRRYLASTIGGKPIDPNLLKKLIKSFERQGGVILIGGDVQKMLDARKIEGLTYNEKLILLDEKASTSTVYEEFIHSAQYRTGRFNKWAEEYGNEAATYLIEKEAAEKLISNAEVWKIPPDEVTLIEERLQLFNDALKKLNL